MDAIVNGWVVASADVVVVVETSAIDILMLVERNHTLIDFMINLKSRWLSNLRFVFWFDVEQQPDE